MIYVIGGVPTPFFSSLIEKKSSFLREGSLVVARPLHAVCGQYRVNEEHAEELKGDLLDRLSSGNANRNDGLCVVFLGHDFFHNENQQFSDTFFPYAPVKHATLPFPVVTGGAAGRQYANSLLPSLRAAAIRSSAAADAMRNELRTRRQRTPLHLPVANFLSSCLREKLSELFQSLGEVTSNDALIKRVCDEIEQEHPFNQLNGRRFFDTSGLAFKMPGRALHGIHWPMQTHPRDCALRSFFRLGGPIEPGFHFDCSYENKQINRVFQDCHGAQDSRQGVEYVNMFPNDYIR